MSNPPLGAPIVLVHGIFGFGQLKLAGVGVTDYFRLIPDALRAEGHVVHEPPSLNMAGMVLPRTIPELCAVSNPLPPAFPRPSVPGAL